MKIWRGLPRGQLFVLPVAGLSLSLVLLLSSCPAHSIFTGLDVPDTEKISGYTGERLLLALEEHRQSAAFYRTLTVVQRERILATLSSMVQSEKSVLKEGELSLILPRSAKAAVELIIHTDPLVYDIIYNLTDPALSALSLSGVSLERLFSAYTSSIRRVLDGTVEEVLQELGLTFYNLYRISVLYQDAVDSARYGMYSGGDLQTYILAGILGALIVAAEKVVEEALYDYVLIAERLAAAYYRLVDSGMTERQLVDRLFQGLAGQLEAPLEEILKAYKLELVLMADIFEALAANAGYSLVAQGTARAIRTWGG